MAYNLHFFIKENSKMKEEIYYSPIMKKHL